MKRSTVLVLLSFSVCGCLPQWGVLRSTRPAQAVIKSPLVSIEVAQPARPALHILALSGGGSYGAFTSGVLSGWSRSNSRPEFDVVTGISTGALIAPMAFLGNNYDYELKKFYTEVCADDVFQYRSVIEIPFRESIARLSPLRHIVETNLNKDVVLGIAAEHRKGRRLYVATTNLDTRKLVIWDLGAIACQGGERSSKLIHNIILASASVPGMFPPVPIEVEVNGKIVSENHVDGGVTAPLFVPPGVIESAVAGVHVYAIVAGKVFPSVDHVPAKFLKVIAASGVAMMHAHTRSEVTSLAQRTKAAGGTFHVAYLRQNFKATDNGVQFNTNEMNRFFVEGVRVGLGEDHAGPTWSGLPYSLSPDDANEVRTGARFRTYTDDTYLPPTNTPPTNSR